MASNIDIYKGKQHSRKEIMFTILISDAYLQRTSEDELMT